MKLEDNIRIRKREKHASNSRDIRNNMKLGHLLRTRFPIKPDGRLVLFNGAPFPVFRLII